MVSNYNFIYFDISNSLLGYSRMYPSRLNIRIPGIVCDICGSTWGSFCHLGPYDVPDIIIKIFNNLERPWPMERKEHELIENKIKNVLKDKYPDIILRPGTRFGPLLLELSSYKVPSFLTNICSVVVPENVLQILKEEKITGFESYPAKVVKVRKPRRTKEKIPKMYELRIVGKSELKKEESGVFLDEKCDACGRLTYTPPKKFVHDIEKWDGSDIFRFDYFLHTIVTEKFKNVCEKYKFTNCEFTPLEEFKPYEGP